MTSTIKNKCPKTTTHQCSFRIYYEDTDAGGVVYYANYLKFAERARTEWLRDLGFNQQELATSENRLFVVRDATMQLHTPCYLDDMIQVKTAIVRVKGASLQLKQTIWRDDNLIATITVTIVSVDRDFTVKPLIASIKATFT